MSILKLTQYTDPMCSWCYGTEPAMKKLEYLMGDDLEVRYVLGLMLPSPEAVLGSGEAAEIRLRQVKNGLDNEFNRVRTVTGMPFDLTHMKNMEVQDFTTYPMSLAYEAAKLADPGKADSFLSRERQATHADNQNTSDYAVLRKLAGEERIDLEQYDLHMADGSAEAALQADINECRAVGAQGFPTLLFEYEGKKGITSGYQTYERLLGAVRQMTGGAVIPQEKEGTMENVQDFIAKFHRVAAIELKTAFNFTDQELEDVVKKLTESGAYAIDKSAYSYFIREVPVMHCDPVTGVCSL